jgi:hypothetical protein
MSAAQVRSGFLAGFTVFDFSIGLVVPVLCILFTAAAVLVNLLQGREEKSVERQDVEKRNIEEEVPGEKLEGTCDTVQIFVELEAGEEVYGRDKRSKAYDFGGRMRIS